MTWRRKKTSGRRSYVVGFKRSPATADAAMVLAGICRRAFMGRGVYPRNSADPAWEGFPVGISKEEPESSGKRRYSYEFYPVIEGS